MKVQIRFTNQRTLWLALALIFNIHSTQAQPTFPLPNIQQDLTHEGDLVLTGDQSMTIENTHYKINGSIFLKDSSNLIIRQSIIELSGGAEEGNGIRLQGSSNLQADTTIFGDTDLTGVIDASDIESIKMGDIWTEHNSRLIMNN